MDIRKFSEVYLPIILVTGSGVFAYASLASDVQHKASVESVVRIEERQEATQKVVERIEDKMDRLLEELRKDK